MPRSSALELSPGPVATQPDARICVCGCGRCIDHKRADARTFDASCRQRLSRDKAKAGRFVRLRCRCGAGALAVVDGDGDLCCVVCGRVRRAHVAARVVTFDATARLMATNRPPLAAFPTVLAA